MPNESADPRARVVDAFATHFDHAPPLLARAPGRVNLIGEHTDYNDGFVLPVAIDRACWIAFQPRDDALLGLESLDTESAAAIELAHLPAQREGSWVDYAVGVAWALGEAGLAPRRGLEGMMSGDVPQGAGLSSSAALELAVARALAATSELPWDPARMALIAQRAENAFVGVKSGIMDQMISASGRAGHALLLDCRTLETRHVPVPPGAAVVVLDTATRRELVTSAYNERRAQCERAAAFFGVKALRDVDVATFEAREAELDDVTRRRARHVVTENARTLAAADALARGDLAEMGRLMDASHASLRDDFEVSRRELDAIVEIARAQAGCWGARMTGAGFGGCAVALGEAGRAETIAAEVARRYEAEVGLKPAVYVCTPSDGASLERV
ncbi:Galactokinase [Gemmatirosa kalamazoonensis]|uniref:Galactokinase n=1 Tax=Gemmatirosa kalamazoonensis TaxID=861299 RepID=W0RR03_9BACT|nr:galactokinase [Gemmatirosa kalamazoonensis]AHG92003.1 Galactokinase [Gemmatirosa kalamazoonensis]